ncbi:MAG: oligosaccharide flippase family protein, partial [Brevundimonas sp.]|nr:oligosaccharide flippase family protein [Brevundimonas sp.]
RAFGVIARSMMSQSSGGNLLKIVLGVFGAGPLGLLFGQIVSQCGGIIIQLRNAYPEARGLTASLSLRRMRRAMAIYWQFPAFQLPSQLFAIGAEQAPIFFIAAQFDTKQTGSFGLAMAVIGLPVMMIAKSISISFYGNVAEIGRNRAADVMALLLSVVWRVLLVSVPLCVALGFAAKPLFPLVFGPNWALAGEVTAALAPFLVGILLFTSINRVLSVFHRQDIKLALDLQRALVVLGVFAWAYWTGANFISTIWTYSWLMLAIFVLSTGWVFVFIKKS